MRGYPIFFPHYFLPILFLATSCGSSTTEPIDPATVPGIYSYVGSGGATKCDYESSKDGVTFPGGERGYWQVTLATDNGLTVEQYIEPGIAQPTRLTGTMGADGSFVVTGRPDGRYESSDITMSGSFGANGWQGIWEEDRDWTSGHCVSTEPFTGAQQEQAPF